MRSASITSARESARQRYSSSASRWREATARERRTKVDWAHEVAALLEGRYAVCERITPVLDDLNTDTKGAFYSAFKA